MNWCIPIEEEQAIGIGQVQAIDSRKKERGIMAAILFLSYGRADVKLMAI